MKQLFLGVAALIIALFAGILVADRYTEKPTGHLSVDPKAPKPPPKEYKSICEVKEGTPTSAETISIESTLADFESGETKMIDLGCVYVAVRVKCAEVDLDCKNVLADLKAAEAATARVKVTGEYLEPGSPERDDSPGWVYRIRQFVEIGMVSFATEPDQPFPSIEGARNRPAKKPETLKNKVNSYTPVGNGKVVGQRSSSGAGENIKK